MILKNQKENSYNHLLFNNKFWLFSIACLLVRNPKICLGVQFFNETVNELRKTDLNNVNTSKCLGVCGKRSKGMTIIPTTVVLGGRYILNTDNNFLEYISEDNYACSYSNVSNRLLCNGSINYEFLKKIQKEEISYFIVENYTGDYLLKEKFRSNKSLETGEWYLMMPKMYQKLTGQIYLEDSGVEVNVNMRLLPLKGVRGFYVEGQAFSNKVLKIAWTLTGKLSLDFLKNRTEISLQINASGGSHWTLRSSLTFFRNNENEADRWNASGFITSVNSSENQFIFYSGTVWTQLIKEECRFLGKVQVQNGNLGVSLSGKLTPPQERQIIIPKSAFSNMTIKNIIFKNSSFYNNFDRNSFEGVRGLKTITFTDSKLEMLPRLDELFQSFTDLEEIYIEDCIALHLKFGSLPVLRNVRKLSFKGSGPFNFDDTTFMWLKNSNLTSLSLRGSNVKIFLKGNSLFWCVSNSLKDLDISYSTVNGEKELALVLNDLSIITLKAEGLNLKKIPTIGLRSIRTSLQFLSLGRNDFRKKLDRQMFDSIFNFPIMPNLKELNLEECHINFIERGAFDNLPNLKILHLSYNNLENLQDGWTHIRPQIKHLSLRQNGFFPKTLPLNMNENGITMNLSKFEELRVLDLSDGIFMNINKLIGGLGSSLQSLFLRNTGLEDPPEDIFENLSGVETLDLSYNRNIKTKPLVSLKFLRNLKNLRNLDLKHCRISGAFIFQSYFTESNKSDYFMLENLGFLDLSVNNFKILDSRMLRAFPKLEILNLSGNSITEWKTDISFNENLHSVFLEENKINTITPEMLSNIKKLKEVKLGKNPFICGSYVYEILKIVSEKHENQILYNGPGQDSNANDTEKIWEFKPNRFDFLKKLLNHTNNEEEMKSGSVHILDWSEKNYVCFSWLQSKFIPFNEVNEDFQELKPEKEKSDETTLLWLIVVVIIGVVITLAITCWKFLNIHLITRAVRNAVALTFISCDEKDSTDFRYNVFVSYCDKDRSWVVENLLPRLESKSDVKVCLHERDFQVGLSIIENILNSIESSRNIILVLSQAFLKSQWCQYEMQLAQFRLLEKGRDQLLLIFLENIPVVKRPKALKYLMMTKTYLQWPLNPKSTSDFDIFWNRLMNSLIIKEC